MPKYRTIKLICDACCRMPQNLSGRTVGKGKSAAGCLILDEQNNIIRQTAKYLGELSPPQAEYQGLIFALDCAVELCRENIEVWMDSELVIKQMNGDYCIRSVYVKPLFDEVKKLENRFLGRVRYFHHSRGSFWGRQADKLANAEYSRTYTG